jgi:prepilin-type N-terminal cleavage/methylation domain-containing protein
MRLGACGAGSSERGFSAVEMLVVLLLLGLVGAALAVTARNTWGKSTLDSTATEIDSFLTKARAAAVSLRAPVFVRLDPTRRVLELADAPSGGALLASRGFPDWASLSASSPTGLDCNWPEDAAGIRVVGCDTLGRAIDPSTGAMVASALALTVTRKDMVAGRVRPGIRYVLRVSPLWYVDRVREMY